MPSRLCPLPQSTGFTAMWDVLLHHLHLIKAVLGHTLSKLITPG